MNNNEHIEDVKSAYPHEQNKSQPQMSYAPPNGFYGDVDDITRPIKENDGAPSLGNVQQDPYLNNENLRDFDRDYEDRERVQEVDEQSNSGMPSLNNSQLQDQRRLS